MHWSPLLIAIAMTTPASQDSLATRWAAGVTPANVHREYPRPQMVRKDWTNLNGLWDFAITKDAARPLGFSRKILVPFPVESKLSRIGEMVPQGNTVWYKRSIVVPKGPGRVLLHFGAVDWHARVFIDGDEIGEHKGGFDPFSFDITEHVKGKAQAELVVAVTDPTDAGPQPRGKQVRKPEGIFYTPTTGIWQTVWMESVPTTYIRSIRIDTSPRTQQVEIRANIIGDAEGLTLKAQALDGKRLVAASSAEPDGTVVVRIPAAKLWSPDVPFLYDLRVWIENGRQQLVDGVDSYFGMRDIAVGPGKDGKQRILLNGRPYFLVGLLDQGYWPDGLLTPPSDEALKYDLEITKRLGFNTVRKHVKVELPRFYYWCDRLGLAVIQDMPSGDRYIGPSDPDIVRSPESKEIYERELKAMVDTHFSHPSIIAWVPFNEGWGQFDTARITDWVKKYDPDRLVISASGWTDRGTGDINDIHVYPGPGAPRPEEKRAGFLGEFGGLGLVVPGHTWQKSGWGYRSYKTRQELTEAVVGLFRDLRFLIHSNGLSGAIYTQTTDVETELNGILTYDRGLVKLDERQLREAILALHGPAPMMVHVVPTAQTQAIAWRYTTKKPPQDWTSMDFQANGWGTGPSGFGTPETPGAVVRTRWDTSDIWIRREFTLPSDVSTENLFLNLHHDEAAEIYLDGKLIKQVTGWTTAYRLHPLPKELKSLKKGRHVIAIHCAQTSGGQYIDAGFVRVVEPSSK